MTFLKDLHFLPAVIALATLHVTSFRNSITHTVYKDTSRIEHRLDGSITEWPADKFTTDEDSSLWYMVDNDSVNLYLALSIPNQGLQLKLSRMGMKLFIDLKGKKKEGMGIEFPIKKESGGFGGGMPSQSPGGQNNGQAGGFDPERMKRAMILSMIQLKLFGFGEEEPKAQQLELPGSAQVASNWDSTGTLHIEYLVPLTLLGKKYTLDQKTISLGWKINGAEISSTGTPPSIGNTTSTASTRGRPTSRPGKINQAEIDRIMKEQKIWTKFTFSFLVRPKDF